MRAYINGFRQDVLMKMYISANEFLVLDQFARYSSPDSDMKRKYKDDKAYFWITYGKIKKDLPILKITDRTFRNYIHKFTQLGIIDKFSDNSTELYIHLNLDVLTKEPLSNTYTIADSPTRFIQDGDNMSRITISTGSYMLYNQDITVDVKKAIMQAGLKQFKKLFIDHLKCQLGNEHPALNGAFDSVDINISINYVVEIKAIHASIDALDNLDEKIFKSISYAILNVLHRYPQSYPQANSKKSTTD